MMDSRVCIVTGSSSGIGEGTALLLASRGASVTLCGRDEARLNEVFNKCVEASGGHPERFLLIRGDLTAKAVRKEIVEKTIDSFGRLDVLVLNAGIFLAHEKLSDLTEQDFDRIFNINVKSPLFLLKESVPYLEQAKGNIVVVSSTSSVLSLPKIMAYCMTKSALDHMTRCLAVDLGPKGIRINTVNPGYIPNGTRMLRNSSEHQTSRILKDAERQQSRIPLERSKALTIEDVAEAIACFASEAAGFITGQNLMVDGGRTLCGSKP